MQRLIPVSAKSFQDPVQTARPPLLLWPFIPTQVALSKAKHHGENDSVIFHPGVVMLFSSFTATPLHPAFKAEENSENNYCVALKHAARQLMGNVTFGENGCSDDKKKNPNWASTIYLESQIIFFFFFADPLEPSRLLSACLFTSLRESQRSPVRGDVVAVAAPQRSPPPPSLS